MSKKVQEHIANNLSFGSTAMTALCTYVASAGAVTPFVIGPMDTEVESINSNSSTMGR